MRLSIDTTNSENIKVKIGKISLEKEARERKSQLLLETIAQGLHIQKKTLKDIDTIEFVNEQGSFTGLRVGASVTNALGFALKIPVNGKDVIKEGPVEPTY